VLTSKFDVMSVAQWWRTACVASVQWGEGSVVAVDFYTLRGRSLYVFGVKSGDLCGSEGAVARTADWHSGAMQDGG
jgi:hypothetical protein